MPKKVMERIISFLQTYPGLGVDITGGCPELNPDFRFFIESTYGLASSIMVRTNLTVLLEPDMEWIPQWYRDHKAIVVGSLPCYTKENVDKQRGPNVFDKSIKAIQLLNGLGYGADNTLELDLVYNPGGSFLPGPQEKLEADYKRELNEEYGIRFNKLFTITNAPIGRCRQYLESNGLLEKYKQLLISSFNPEAAKNIMCRTLISVDYMGRLYNCDFNQALSLPIIDTQGNAVTLERLEKILSSGLEIITDDHCFCCTAASGSSCTGSLVR
jgi:radical SAM/Cys-rich protein